MSRISRLANAKFGVLTIIPLKQNPDAVCRVAHAHVYTGEQIFSNEAAGMGLFQVM
jgi:hypothetical protein